MSNLDIRDFQPLTDSGDSIPKSGFYDRQLFVLKEKDKKLLYMFCDGIAYYITNLSEDKVFDMDGDLDMNQFNIIDLKDITDMNDITSMNDIVSMNDILAVNNILNVNQMIFGAGTTSSADPICVISRDVDGLSGTNGHAFVDESQVDRDGTIGYASFDADPTAISGGGEYTYDHIVGFQSRPSYQSDGNIALFLGFTSALDIRNSSGTITDAVHYKAKNLTGSGATVTNQYGFYVQETLDRASGSNTNWAFYSNGTTQSFLQGNLKIGNDTTEGLLAVQSATTGTGYLVSRGTNVGNYRDLQIVGNDILIKTDDGDESTASSNAMLIAKTTHDVTIYNTLNVVTDYELNGSSLALVTTNPSPGNARYYGFNAANSLGYHALSSGWVGTATSNLDMDTYEILDASEIIVGSLTSTSNDPAITVQRTITGAGNAHAFVDTSSVNKTGTIGYNSFDAQATIAGSNAYDHMVGFQSRPTYNSSNNIVNFYGFTSALDYDGSGNITRVAHYKAKNITGVDGSSGTITTQYGYLVEETLVGTTAGTPTVNWAFASLGTTESFFQGNVKVGNDTTKGWLIVQAVSGDNGTIASRGTDVSNYRDLTIVGNNITIKTSNTNEGTASSNVITMDTVNHRVTFVNEIIQKVNTNNVSNPPTDAELDAIWTSPATVGAGFTAYIDDNNAHNNVYQIMSDGTAWHYFTATKAV